MNDFEYLEREKVNKEYMQISQLRRSMILEYFSGLVIFMMITTLIFCAAGFFMSKMKIWYPDETAYLLLKPLKNNPITTLLAVWLIGAVMAGGYAIVKQYRYIKEIAEASKKMIYNKEDKIMLSPQLKTIELQMELTREQFLRNSMLSAQEEQKKNDLIMYLAHDLKTPLTSIIGYLTLLRDEKDISIELRAKYTGIALEKAERLEDLINEFFDITRFNLTSITLEKEQINLSRMAEQIVSEFEPVLSEKDLRWNIHIEPDIMMVCDSNKLERVFDNLIRNAVNYSYRNTEIKVCLTKNNKEIVLNVENYGRTISSEKLEHIFEQFFRLDSARSSSTGGAGLGLAIAKEIVELHGGMIEAKSKEESIRFTVIFPV